MTTNCSMSISIDTVTIDPVPCQTSCAKKRKPKTPNAFFLYCQEARTEAHRLHPELTSREVTKLLADEWKQLSSQEKSEYITKYKNKLKESEPQTLPCMIRIMADDGRLYSVPAIKISE